MGWFDAPKPDPSELVKEWRKSLRREQRALDRQILSTCCAVLCCCCVVVLLLCCCVVADLLCWTGIEREESKIKTSIKQAARKGNVREKRIV